MSAASSLLHLEAFSLRKSFFRLEFLKQTVSQCWTRLRLYLLREYCLFCIWIYFLSKLGARYWFEQLDEVCYYYRGLHADLFCSEAWNKFIIVRESMLALESWCKSQLVLEHLLYLVEQAMPFQFDSGFCAGEAVYDRLNSFTMTDLEHVERIARFYFNGSCSHQRVWSLLCENRPLFWWFLKRMCFWSVSFRLQALAWCHGSHIESVLFNNACGWPSRDNFVYAWACRSL